VLRRLPLPLPLPLLWGILNAAAERPPLQLPLRLADLPLLLAL
jgi:hypothetical protein